MPQYQPRIAIVGGGPSGLTVGVLLHKHHIPFTIFDLRPQLTADDLARPAGMLDLHDESGIAALKACGLLDKFSSLTSDCSEIQLIADKEGSIIATFDRAEVESRPEISRNTLTQLLLDHVPPESVKWNHKLIATNQYVTSSGTTEIELDFGSNGKHVFDFVVGADGTWSRVRHLLTDVRPRYAGIQLITVTIREVTKKYPWLADYVGSGTFMAMAHRHGIMSQRGPQDSARIYICLTTADEQFGSTSGISVGPASDAPSKLLTDEALLGGFGPQLKELVQTACSEDSTDSPDTNCDIKPLYMLPIGHSWTHQTGATAIGDASHVMCPWAAEGVNLAMWDALDVAFAVIKAWESSPVDASTFQTTLDPLIEEFEAVMAERAKGYAQETVENGLMMFGDEDGSRAMKRFFDSVMPTTAEEAGDGSTKVFSE